MEQEKQNSIYSYRARLRELLNADDRIEGQLNEPIKIEIRRTIARLRFLGDTDYIKEYAKEYMV